MKPFFVYILKCNDGSYYTGHTDNMEARLSAHQQGLCSGYTSKRRPVELVYVDTCGSRAEAIINERKIKGWTKAKKEALIRGDWEEITRLTNHNIDKNYSPTRS